MSTEDELLSAARRAMTKAYAPYSGFHVGAAVLAASGRIYASCNVENASYPLGVCAEAGAISAMVTAGDRVITRALVVSDGNAPCSPCGGCRQRLLEFAGEGAPIHLCDRSGVCDTVEIATLLPHAFSAGQLP